MIQTPNPISTKELGENTVDQNWLEGDLSCLEQYEPYDWGNVDPLTLGKPVKYILDVGFRIEGDKDNA